MPGDVYAYKQWHDSVTRAKYVKEESLSGADSVKKRIIESKKKTLADRFNPRKVTSDAPQAVVIASKKKSRKMKIDSANISSVEKLDSVFRMEATREIYQAAANSARHVQNQMAGTNSEMLRYRKDAVIFEIQWHKIIASSFACVAMFLIGAPLGAIIKKGGLGVPFLVSVLFFIIYYVLTIQGEKFAKQDQISVVAGVWLPDLILLVIGLIFLRQARVDARLFDTDFYHIAFDRLKTRLKGQKLLAKPA
jgi:lipopolysaccharide export system permease protein